MGFFNSETTPQKAVEMLGSDKEEKITKGVDFLMTGGSELVPFIVESFEKTVPQAGHSKKSMQTATNLYMILCRSELPADLCQNILKTLINAPAGVSFDLEFLPLDVYENGYTVFESILRDDPPDTKKKMLPYVERIALHPSTLPILASLLTRESGFAEQALELIPRVEGDLSPISDALYKMMDLYPLGDAALKAILELQDRLAPNLPLLKRYLFDFNSQIQKRAIKVAVILAETDKDVYLLLRQAIKEDESSRAHTLEILEKIQTLAPDQLDLLWLILTHSTTGLTDERGMKFVGRIEKQIRPVVLWYAQNGTQNEIICAFRCMGYMKEEGPAVCSGLLPVYLQDETLLYENAGLQAFSHIAGILKLYCAKDASVPALAKKMRDFCVQRDVETPTEVMAILGHEDLTDIIEWSLKKIYENYGIGYTFAYSEEMMKGISDLVGFDKTVLNTFIKAMGFAYVFDTAENMPVITHKETVSAINRLRSVNTPATTNLLYLVSMKRDVELTQTDSTGLVISTFKLSFAEHRKLALEELNRRGGRPYSPANYLKNAANY